MKKKRIESRGIVFSIVIMLTLMIVACGGAPAKKRSQTGHMDTPSFHVQRGDEALMKSQYEPARSAYKKALSLDGNYSPALSGLAAATAYEASRPGVSEQTKKAGSARGCFSNRTGIGQRHFICQPGQSP